MTTRGSTIPTVHKHPQRAWSRLGQRRITWRQTPDDPTPSGWIVTIVILGGFIVLAGVTGALLELRP